MENSKQIAQRFKEVMLSGDWVANTNYKKLLSQITWEQATYKIPFLNTIAELTYHVNYYITGVLNVFLGGNLEIKDKYSFSMSPIYSQEDWENLRNSLEINSEKFANHVDALSNEKLEEIFVDKKYGNYQRNIEGIIEHSYYHLGQISLIYKMQI